MGLYGYQPEWLHLSILGTDSYYTPTGNSCGTGDFSHSTAILHSIDGRRFTQRPAI
jgi:hypothetical protein